MNMAVNQSNNSNAKRGPRGRRLNECRSSEAQRSK
jgi:hypothetical protein